MLNGTDEEWICLIFLLFLRLAYFSGKRRDRLHEQVNFLMELEDEEKDSQTVSDAPDNPQLEESRALIFIIEDDPLDVRAIRRGPGGRA